MDGLEIRANPLGVLEAGWRKVMDAARLASPERPRTAPFGAPHQSQPARIPPFALFVTSFLIGLNKDQNLEGKTTLRGCKVSAYCSVPPNKRSSQLIWSSCLDGPRLLTNSQSWT